MSDDGTHQTEDHGGQQAIGGPGTEKQGPHFTNKVTGPTPDGAKLKLKGGTVEWDGDELQRQERVTLIVDCVVSGVGLEDDLDVDNYPKKTWRVQTCQVESIRQATPDEHSRIAVGLFRATARPESLGEPPSDAPADTGVAFDQAVADTLRESLGDDVTVEVDVALPSPDADGPDAGPDEGVKPEVLRADQVVYGDVIVLPGSQDGVLHEVYDVLPQPEGQEQVVRLLLDAEDGEILELTADQEITGDLLPRDADGNAIGGPDPEADDAEAANDADDEPAAAADDDDPDMRWENDDDDDE